MNQKELARQLQGARNYAAADRSDPFALSRALAHIRCGITANGDKGEDNAYGADRATETRKLAPGDHFSDGSTEYQVTAWRNVRRP